MLGVDHRISGEGKNPPIFLEAKEFRGPKKRVETRFPIGSMYGMVPGMVIPPLMTGIPIMGI